MIKNFKLLKLTLSRNKTLFWGVIISLLIHFFLLSKPLFKLPVLDKGKQTFNVSLVNQLTTQESAIATNIKPLQSSVIKIPKPARIKPEAAANHTATPETTLLPIESNKSVGFTDAAIIALNHLPQPYHYIETDFEIYRDNTVNASTTSIVFIIDENNTYTLTSITQTNSLASLYLDSLIQKSEIVSQGVVLENGLRPNSYSYLYGSNNMRNANFAWSDGLLEMNSEQGKKAEPILVGTQDFLSYMYQFMFSPPLEDTEITMANADKQTTYTYSLQGEEEISTKLGKLNTLHLLISDGEEKTELWLGIDYQYLPVKIRETKKNGSVTDEVVTNIYTSLP